jgi:hypothetical protein
LEIAYREDCHVGRRPQIDFTSLKSMREVWKVNVIEQTTGVTVGVSVRVSVSVMELERQNIVLFLDFNLQNIQ